MSNSAAQFITYFARRLSDPNWLPFLAPPFEVIAPHESPLVQEHFDKAYPLKFEIKANDAPPFGHISVVPKRVRFPKYNEGSYELDCLLIGGINSGYEGSAQHNQELKLGRELVRRTVWFALKEGKKKVRTSIFYGEASSFWLGHGFRSYDPCSPNEDIEPVEPEWQRADEVSREWREKLQNNPDVIWDLARTEAGRRVLKNTGNCGILDFNDVAQRNYAFERLKLPPVSYSRG